MSTEMDRGGLKAVAGGERRNGGVVAEMGRRIVRLRQGKGWAQAELARRLGVSRERLGSWERGCFMPAVDGLLALRRVLGISIDELLTGEPPAPAPGISREEKEAVLRHLVGLAKVLRLPPGRRGGAEGARG